MTAKKTETTNNLNLPVLAFALALPFVAGFLGSLVTTPAIPLWYQALNKPSFSPPNWLFGPVWTLLYILMGISFYWVLTSDKSKKMILLAKNIFYFQLVLNTLWSVLFFGLRSPILALIDIYILLAVIVIMIIKFRKIEQKAGLLQIPYLVWVSFASLLNLFVVILN